jgi:hypothetical protein
MVAIIGCESNFVHYKPDGTVLRGRVDPKDSGVSQINERYHPSVNTEDLWSNLAYARELFDAEGTGPWVCRNMVAVR